LSAEAREEIACERFTDALGDPDFALKVKERTPKSLDEALCIAEAWAKSVKGERYTTMIVPIVLNVVDKK